MQPHKFRSQDAVKRNNAVAFQSRSQVLPEDPETLMQKNHEDVSYVRGDVSEAQEECLPSESDIILLLQGILVLSDR